MSNKIKEAIEKAETIQSMNKLRMDVVNSKSKEIHSLWIDKFWKMKKKYSYKELKQALSQAVEEAEAGFLNWARDNKHDMGEMGEFVKLEYLENYMKPNWPYTRPYGIKSLENKEWCPKCNGSGVELLFIIILMGIILLIL